MNKRFAWELFKNTGNIDAYMLMKDVEYSEQMLNIENDLQNIINKNDTQNININLNDK